jgi:hypothetical protein
MANGYMIPREAILDLKIGDEIKTNFIPSQKYIMRKITRVDLSKFCQSGLLISCDGGTNGTPINDIDSDWITWVENK